MSAFCKLIGKNINMLTSKMSNVVAVTRLLLQTLNVRVNILTLKTYLESHPEYPSLLAVSDCLNEFKVPHRIYAVEKENHEIANLSFPFIAHFSTGEGSFVLIHSIKDSQVEISDEKSKNRMISAYDFSKLWDGVVLYAQQDKNSGEKNFYQHLIDSILQQIKIQVFAFALLSVFYLLFNLQDFNWINLSLCVVTFTGAVVSMLLLLQSINANHPLLKKLCSAGQKNDCNTILNSKAAKIVSWLSWSEVGFFYFTGSFLVMLVVPALAPVLFWINLSALFYTVYSLFYQYSIKSWCILCCIVQAVLVLEFVLLNLKTDPLNRSFILVPDLLFLFFLCFIIPVVTWSLLKPVLFRASLTGLLQQQLKAFKYNDTLFTAALNSQVYHDINDALMPVVLGNPFAETTITIISNPFCPACKRAHHFVVEWLLRRDDLKIKLLFADDNNKDGLFMEITCHMIALSLLEDKNKVIQALNNWFDGDKMEYKSWAEKYPVKITRAIETACVNQKKWCQATGVNFTPAILVNGYILPEPYELEDLKYLIN